MAGRMAFSLGVAGVCLWLVRVRCADLDLADIIARTTSITAMGWGAALIATCISFWAVGQCDAVVHRHLGTGVSGAEARRAGIAAIAISQTVGAGVITGALLRWRLLRGVSLWQATRISIAVTLSFLAGWAVVTGTVLVALPNSVLPAAPLRAGGAVVLIAAAALAVTVMLAPRASARVHLPNLLTQGRLVALAALDTVAACLALWCLLPPDVTLPLTILLPAFLLALGAGLISGTPGGVGPFEVTLLALLPAQAEPPLLAAIFGWRLIAYALPAILGAIVALIGPARAARGPTPAHCARSRTSASPALWRAQTARKPASPGKARCT
jgi:phosphatidylglycerol lysyltransferase